MTDNNSAFDSDDDVDDKLQRFNEHHDSVYGDDTLSANQRAEDAAADIFARRPGQGWRNWSDHGSSSSDAGSAISAAHSDQATIVMPEVPRGDPAIAVREQPLRNLPPYDKTLPSRTIVTDEFCVVTETSQQRRITRSVISFAISYGLFKLGDWALIKVLTHLFMRKGGFNRTVGALAFFGNALTRVTAGLGMVASILTAGRTVIEWASPKVFEIVSFEQKEVGPGVLDVNEQMVPVIDAPQHDERDLSLRGRRILVPEPHLMVATVVHTTMRPMQTAIPGQYAKLNMKDRFSIFVSSICGNRIQDMLLGVYFKRQYVVSAELYVHLCGARSIGTVRKLDSVFFNMRMLNQSLDLVNLSRYDEVDNNIRPNTLRVAELRAEYVRQDLPPDRHEHMVAPWWAMVLEKTK